MTLLRNLLGQEGIAPDAVHRMLHEPEEPKFTDAMAAGLLRRRSDDLDCYRCVHSRRGARNLLRPDLTRRDAVERVDLRPSDRQGAMRGLFVLGLRSTPGCARQAANVSHPANEMPVDGDFTPDAQEAS